jgi:hypothetical protein
MQSAIITAVGVAGAQSAGDFATAVASLFRGGLMLSLGALIERAPQIRRVARRGRAGTGSTERSDDLIDRVSATKDPLGQQVIHAWEEYNETQVPQSYVRHCTNGSDGSSLAARLGTPERRRRATNRT